MSDIHELKADPTPFEDVYSGRKTAEVRRDDRGYKVGDYLQIRETTADRMAYTGRQLGRRITHIQRGYGLPDGVVVLSLESRPTPEQSGEARDAARYRWLRHADLDALAASNWGDGEVYEGDAFDAAIDSAMARSALGRDAENTRAITADSAENGALTGERP